MIAKKYSLDNQNFKKQNSIQVVKAFAKYFAKTEFCNRRQDELEL